MATIGMRYPVFAKVATEPANAALTYTGGMVMGHAISGNLTITRNDNPLYGDDVIVEDDNGVTAMSIEMGLDDIDDAVRVALLGDKANETAYETVGEGADPVGFGYIRVRRKAGVTKYQAVWYYKAVFSETSENSQTKAERIEWQTPTITGRIMGVYNDATGVAKFRIRQDFDTEALAKTFLNTKAGIT